MTEVIRELTTDERMKWGDCPACGAKHGQECDANVGYALGMNAYGQRPMTGAHLGRLQRAPFKVREVPL